MTRTTTAPRTALTQEGRGEISTLDELFQRYRCSYITVEQLLNDHLQHLGSLDALRRAIKAGRIQLELSRMPGGKKAPQIVHLTNLADFLDKAKRTAADQAA